MNSNHILALSREVFQHLSRPLQTSIAAASVGLINSQKVGIAAVGRGMEGEAQPRSAARRVERLVVNPRLEIQEACRGLRLGGMT